MYLLLVDLLDILLMLLFHYKIIYHPMPINQKTTNCIYDKIFDFIYTRTFVFSLIISNYLSCNKKKRIIFLIENKYSDKNKIYSNIQVEGADIQLYPINVLNLRLNYSKKIRFLIENFLFCSTYKRIVLYYCRLL